LDIHFVKLQSCGIDYILLDGLKHALPEQQSIPKLARTVVPRRTGIGATGFLILHHGRQEKVGIRQYDAKGKELPPDPDSLRCLARYAFDSGLLDQKRSLLETEQGSYTVKMLDNRNIAVSLPPPALAGEKHSRAPALDRQLAVGSRDVPFTAVSLQGIHAVFFSAFDYRPSDLRRALSRHPLFAQENPGIGLVQMISDEEFRLRVWKPSGRELPAYGAGAGAAAAAAALHEFADRNVVVHCRGGDLYINWGARDIVIAAAVDYVYTGVYYWETWEAAV
jgi:diaminopimelate epimerase